MYFQEKEEQSTMYENSPGSFISRSHVVKPNQKKLSSVDVSRGSTLNSDAEKLLSDSEFSEVNI